jgi:F-type H+-transporting ATPase subunit gamma
MAKGLEIKRRIRSIKSMLQVTKAMELISSIKMKKAQDAATRSKTYVFESWRAIIRLSKLPENSQNPLIQKPKEGKILLLVITSDRGLAGSYNTEVLKKTVQFVEENSLENIDFITMGRKGRDFIRKIGGNIIADFPLGQDVRFSFSSPIALIGWNGFLDGIYSKFISIHSHFESAVRHNATVLQILPVDIENVEESQNEIDLEFKFEPSREEVLQSIIRQSVRALTYQVILESEATEHASRMVAMKNASDAAKDLKEDFEFTYNQIRQQSITAELSEISAGVNAMD